MKSVQIRSFSGPYFSAFGLNTERHGVFSPNARKYGPGKTPYLDTFHVVSMSTRTLYSKPGQQGDTKVLETDLRDAHGVIIAKSHDFSKML